MTGTQPLEHVPPGHDAWIVGDELVVAVDWQGASVRAAEKG
jgi:hypothetical protein